MDEIQISKVRLGTRIPPIRSKGKLLNADDSYMWILRRKHLVGWTFSITKVHVKSFDRLIAGCGLQPFPNVKYAGNVHLKCYIDKKEMLIGSYNLTSPTIEDLCVLVTDITSINHMRIQFNKHWRTL